VKRWARSGWWWSTACSRCRRRIVTKLRSGLEEPTAFADGLDAAVEGDRSGAVPVAGPFGDAGDVAVDGAPVEGLADVALHEPPGPRRGAGGEPMGDELDQQRVQGHVAVVVELADRDRSQWVSPMWTMRRTRAQQVHPSASRFAVARAARIAALADAGEILLGDVVRQMAATARRPMALVRSRACLTRRVQGVRATTRRVE